METRTHPILNGPLMAAAALAAVAGWLFEPRLGLLMAGGWTALALALAGWLRPMSLVWLLLAAAMFNYGVAIGGAMVVKPTEVIQLAMLAVIMTRLAAGDREVAVRLRRAAPLVVALAMLAVITMATSAPHPSFFNTRYEILGYIALLYALLFFRLEHWRPLLVLSMAAVAIQGTVALAMRFILGISGVDLQLEGGGMVPFFLTADILDELSGGRFRLAGTFSHKNMLAAFFVLLLPVVGVHLFRRGGRLGFLALLPALAALALTDSMTGWGALMLVVALMLLFLRRFDYLAVMLLLILPLAAVGLLRFGESIFFRVEQLFGTQSGWGTVSSRVELLQISLRLIGEHPWGGIGRGNFALFGQTWYPHAHNLFLMKLIELGVPGGLAFTGTILAVVGRVWWAILREPARLAAQGQYFHLLGAALGLTGFLGMNLFDYNYNHFSLGPLFMALMGLALAAAMNLPGLTSAESTAPPKGHS